MAESYSYESEFYSDRCGVLVKMTSPGVLITTVRGLQNNTDVATLNTFQVVRGRWYHNRTNRK